MGIYDDDEYEIDSRLEMFDVLAEMPFDLIKENIEDQIGSPTGVTVNYLEIVEDKYNLSKEQYAADDDMLRTLNSQFDDFFYSIAAKISDEYDLGLDLEGVMMDGDIVDVTSALYTFFVLRYTRNVANYVTNYINSHKKSLYDSFNDITKKDVSTLAYKKAIKTKEDLVIISCLPDIIKYIINLDIDTAEFVELCVGENSYEGEILIDLIEDSRLLGDFVKDYLVDRTSDNDYLLDEIYTEIKARLLGESGLVQMGLL